MIDSYPRTLTLLAAIGSGITAGVYFAFSTFVMAGLRKLPHSQGIAAMNSINKAAPNPLFMLALFGTAVTCVLLSISGFRHTGDPAAQWQIIGSALYLIGVILTVVYHVPRNDALMRVDPNGSAAAGAWSHYLAGWLAWNHVRTLTALGGTVCLTLALRAG